MGIKNLLRIGLLMLFALCLFCCSKSTINEEEAKSILLKFYKDDVSESMSDRYLLGAGKPIVPYLAKEVKNKTMTKRQAAIIALGKINDRRALPVLETIINDQSEEVYTRGNALNSIWHIDKKIGEIYAKKYGGDKGYMDRTIELLKEGAI